MSKKCCVIQEDQISKFPEKGLTLPVIVGCIDYKFKTDGDHHQTGFALQILATKFANAGHRPVETGRTLFPGADFILTPYVYDSAHTGFFFANLNWASIAASRTHMNPAPQKKHLTHGKRRS